MRSLARPRDRDDILRRLGRLRPDSRPLWGRMSAPQMVCHLSDACRMATGEKPVSPATGRLHRTLLKWAVLYLPVRWPAGIHTRPEIDQQEGGTGPGEFDADVSELIRLLQRLASRDGSVRWRPHPIFGELSESAWLRWAYLHADHHLRQFGC